MCADGFFLKNCVHIFYLMTHLLMLLKRHVGLFYVRYCVRTRLPATPNISSRGKPNGYYSKEKSRKAWGSEKCIVVWIVRFLFQIPVITAWILDIYLSCSTNTRMCSMAQGMRRWCLSLCVCIYFSKWAHSPAKLNKTMNRVCWTK